MRNAPSSVRVCRPAPGCVRQQGVSDTCTSIFSLHPPHSPRRQELGLHAMAVALEIQRGGRTGPRPHCCRVSEGKQQGEWTSLAVASREGHRGKTLRSSSSFSILLLDALWVPLCVLISKIGAIGFQTHSWMWMNWNLSPDAINI